jgi:hypothetical protein
MLFVPMFLIYCLVEEINILYLFFYLYACFWFLSNVSNFLDF